MKAERLRFEEDQPKRPSPLKTEPKNTAPVPGKKQRRHSMLEHAKKLTESADDAFFEQEADEADTQSVSTQAAETGLDAARQAKTAVHRLYATQADARRAAKQTEASDLPGASPVLEEQSVVSPPVLPNSPPSKTEAPVHHEPTLIGKKEQFSRSHIPDAQAQKSVSNPQSKAQQKKTIRRQYMQAASGQPLPMNVPVSRVAEKAVETGASTVQKQVQTARKRRNVFAFILFAALLCYALNALNGCAPILESTMQVIAMTTYPAEEDDILAAERYYAKLESDLQHELDDYGALHPGCDEYQIEQMDIWHDPYVLISIISAAIGDEWKVDDAVPIMDRLFAQQYILTSSIASETRYRKEWKTGWKQELDPVTGVLEWIPYDYEVDVPYIYKTCTVKLVNKNLSHLLFNVMSHEQVGMYAVYISTHGNMPDLFRNNPYAGELKDPLLYDVPEEYKEADSKFAAMLEEAEKYLGYPYVWGGSDPSTSFDCSGFVSWVLVNSAVKDVGRLGATSLYGALTPIREDEARPGDIIFFQGTLGEGVEGNDGITHCGIYVGDGMMIHCGSPISYADLSRTYWQEHFYGYARAY